jgi:hypothetical protein
MNVALYFFRILAASQVIETDLIYGFLQLCFLAAPLSSHIKLKNLNGVSHSTLTTISGWSLDANILSRNGLYEMFSKEYAKGKL